MQYRQRRYCQHLSRPELNKRIRDIFLNMLRLTEEAKIGIVPLQPMGAIWVEKFTHVLEEMVLRYGPYPAGMARDVLHSEPFPDFASELAGEAARRMTSLKLRSGRILIKLGERKFMRALHAEGRLRIQPASFFKSPDHNGAIRDDELTIGFSTNLNRDEVTKLVANPQDVPTNIPDRRIDIQLEHQSDYWLYCVTRSIEARLFVDFGANACVIIRNPDAFQQRLVKAATAAMPEVSFCAGEAQYFDQLLPSKGIPFIPLTKPFGYAYQSEFRYCWQPRLAASRLEHIDLCLGSLSDISELIEL